MSDVEVDATALAQARQENADKFQRLTTAGMLLDPTMVLKVRVDFLTDRLLGVDTQERMDVEVAWEALLGTILDQGLEQITAPKLLVPGQLSIGDVLGGG